MPEGLQQRCDTSRWRLEHYISIQHPHLEKESEIMFSMRTVLFGGLAACLWSAVAAAQGTTGSVTAFGFNYSPLGNATLDASSGTGVVVRSRGPFARGVGLELSNFTVRKRAPKTE